MSSKFMAAGIAAAAMSAPRARRMPARTSMPSRRAASSICGVNTGVAGFALADSQGKWTGLDVDVCRAVAAAMFGDAEKVEVRAAHGAAALHRPAVGRGRHPVAQHHLDADPRHRARPRFHRHQLLRRPGLHGAKKLGVKSAKELNGATVCVQPGTTTELNLADYFRANKMTFKPVVIEKVEEVRAAFFSGRCDVYTTDASGLYSTRAANAAAASRTTTSSCRRSSPRSRWARWCARATTSSPTSCAGRSTPWSRPRSTASPRRTSTRC